MDIAQATVRVVADTTAAKAGLNDLSRSLTNLNQSVNTLIPGSRVAGNVISRLTGGIYQLIQGVSASAFNALTSGMKKAAQAGVETAKSLDSAKVSLDNLIGGTEDVDALLKDIQKNAITTPFDIEGLAKGTQQLALVTKNGAQAERTILNLGKAVAAGGGGTEQLNRLAANLQEIGLNANITTRDIRQFGTASVPIMEMVADTVGISTDKVTEYLKSVSNPYDVLVEAINRAGEEGGRFANQYTASAMTMGQVTENLADSFGIFSRNVGEASGILTRVKEAMMAISERLIDPTLVGTLADAIAKLTQNLNLVDLATGAIDNLMKVLGAFNSGQFDNFFVFFQELFNTLKQSDVVRIFAQAFKVILDLFSDNHTAEEVRRVAQEIGNFINVLLNFKIVIVVIQKVSGAVGSLMNLMAPFATMFGGLANVISAHPFFAAAAGATALLVVLNQLGALDPVKEFFSSLWNDIQQAISAFGQFAQSLVVAGHNMIVGLWNGLVDGFNGIIGKVVEMGRAIANAFKSALGIHSPSTVMRDEVGKPIDEGIAEGIRKNYGTVLDAADEVLEKLVDLQKEWVEEVADVGALDLVQQVNVYKDFARLYQQGSKARLEMDERVHDAEMKITKQIIQLTDDFNTQFTKSVKNAKEFYNVFEYTQGVITRTTASIIEGMNRQNTNMLQYLRNLQKINSMGFDSDFLQEIMDQGMDAAGEVAGLAEASEDEIEEINKLWKERGQIATDIAVENTKELRQETLEQIEYLQSGLDKRIVEVTDSGTLLVKNFTVGIYDGMPTVQDAVDEIAANASSSAKKAGKGVADGVGSAFEDIGEMASAAVPAIDDYTGALDRLDIEAFELGGAFDLVKNLLSGIPWYAWVAAIGAALITVVSKVKAFRDALQMKEAIKNASAGISSLAETMKGGGNSIIKTAENVSTKTSNTYSKLGKIGAKINRPFKKFNTFLEGLGSSIDSLVNLVLDRIFNLAQRVASGLGNTIKAFLEPLSDPQLLVGVGVLAALGATMIIFAAAAEIFTKVGLEGAGMLAVFAVEIGVLAAATAALGTVTPLVLAGATALTALGIAITALGVAVGVAFSAIGLGLKVAAQALVDVGQLASQISVGGIAVMLAAITTVSLILAAVSGFAVLGAIGSIASAILGVGLVITASALATASKGAEGINISAIATLADTITLVSVVLGVVSGFAVLGAIGSIASAVLGVGLLLTATAMAEVSKRASEIDTQAISRLVGVLAETSIALTLIAGFAALGAVATVATDIIAGGLLLAALALKKTAELANEINTDGITQLMHVVEYVDVVMGILMPFASFGAISAIATDIIAGGLLLAAKALAEAAVLGAAISVDGIKLLMDTVTFTSKVMSAILGYAAFGAIGSVANETISGGLLYTAEALQAASKAGAAIQTDGIQHLMDTVVFVRSVLDQLVQIAAVNVSWKDMYLVEQVRRIADNLGQIISTVSWCLQELKKLDGVGNEFETYRQKLTDTIEKLANLDLGNVKQAKSNQQIISKIKDIANTVKEVVSSVTEVIKDLASLPMSSGDVDKYVGQAQRIVEKLAEFTFDDTAKNYKGNADKASKVKDIATNVKEIISSAKSIVDDLSSFASMGVAAVERYVEQAKTILGQFARVSIEDGEYEQTNRNVEQIKGTASNLSVIIESAKSIVDNIKAFAEQEADVPASVQEADNILNAFSKVGEHAEEVKEETSNQIGLVKAIAENLSSVLNNAKTIIENINWFKDNVANGVEGVTSLINDANTILDSFKDVGKDLGDGYDAIKSKVEMISGIATTLNTVLTQAKTMSDNIRSFKDSEQDMPTIVEEVNQILAAIVGGESGGGLKIAAEEGEISSLATKLDSMKAVVVALAGVSKEIQEVQDIGDGKAAIHNVVEAITTELAELPTQLANYDATFKLQGNTWAQNLIDGWNEKKGEATTAALEMQGDMWAAIEGKMQDEYYQGAALAGKVLEGIQSKRPEFNPAGASLQGEFWSAIEGKLQDEYYQGRALANKVLEGIHAIQNEGGYEAAGAQVSAGFARGISGTIGRVNVAVGNLSDAAISKLRELLGIASPSKVFAQLGAYVAEGFAEGVEDNLDSVLSTGEALAKAVMEGYNDTIMPLTATVARAKLAGDSAPSRPGEVPGDADYSGSGRSVVINQTNNVYDEMDETKLVNDLAWAVARA